MRDFRRLQVWQRAHRLSLEVYRATEGFPDSERFGLTSQMRRAATALPSNIAEGSGRGSQRDFARFLKYATGSANELESQLILAGDLGYLTESTTIELIGAVGSVRAMLLTLERRLSRSRLPRRSSPAARRTSSQPPA